MINPFRKIENNSRWTYNDLTIVVESSNLFYVSWYYLGEWWKTQHRKVHLHKTNRFMFILNASKYAYL